MTRKQFDRLEDGVMVWFRPPYLAYKMPGVVRTIGGRRGVWVNFFGDGQTHFTPQEGREGRFASWVEPFLPTGGFLLAMRIR